MMRIKKPGEARPFQLPVTFGKIGDPWFPNAQDVQQWAVYAAEYSVSSGCELEGLTDAQNRINDVLNDPRFSLRYPLMSQIDVTIHNNLEESTGQPVLISRAGPRGPLPYRSAAISMHENMLNESVLFHELAHCVQPKYADRSDRHKGEPVWSTLDHGHDEWFRATFCWLLEAFGSDTTHQELRDAYEHFNLTVPDDDQLLTLLARDAQLQPLVQAERDKQAAESEAFYASMGQNRPVFSVPLFDLGDVFRMMRRHHKVTKGHVSSLVSRVQRCTTVDITRMENLSALPDSHEERLLALYVGVAVGIDPRWLFTGYGLHRNEVGAKMKDLMLINRRWVETVRWMNRTQQARPPRWIVEGER